MIRNEVERRYYDDLAFRHLVDVIESCVNSMQLTPSEVREASMLACLHHEMRRTKPIEISLQTANEVQRNVHDLQSWLDSLEAAK